VPVNRLASVTRCTVKEAFTGKHREQVRSLLKRSLPEPENKSTVSTLSCTDPKQKFRRGSYFKKLRRERGLLSLLRRFSLPTDFSRENRRILRGVYYSIPRLSRRLYYLPDQLSLAEVAHDLYCWLLLANINRGSNAVINRLPVRTFAVSSHESDC